MPDVQTIDQLFAEMEGKFRADKASGMNATFQFEISGDDGGTWHAKIADGSCAFGQGPIDGANVTISAASSDWSQIVSGSLNPQMAFMTGKIKVRGDLGLATKLGTLFF